MRSLYIFIANLILAIFISVNVSADTTYIIKKGDSPYSIAKKFKVSAQDIIKANHLKASNLKPGTKITILSDRNDSLNKNTAAKKQVKKTYNKNVTDAKHQEYASVHIVKKGDTLLSISKRYSISVNELRELNNLRSTKLKTGQKILVKKVRPKTYTVKKGDTIYQVARKFDIDPDELKNINHLETDVLITGQKILLEPDGEANEAKTYDAILSQVHGEKDTEQISADESNELADLGMQDRLILFAKKLLDIPYRFGGNSLWGIDCSAFVQKTYGVVGINLPRSAREQFSEGNPVDKEELSIGDLVFFRTYASFPSHVGIYLGNNLFIHASSRSKKVTIDSLNTPYYLKRFIGAKRVIGEKAEKEVSEREG